MSEADTDGILIGATLGAAGIVLSVTTQLCSRAFVSSVMGRTLVGSIRLGETLRTDGGSEDEAVRERCRSLRGHLEQDFCYVLDLAGAYASFCAALIAGLLNATRFAGVLSGALAVLSLAIWRFWVESLGVDGFYQRRRLGFSWDRAQLVIQILVASPLLVQTLLP